MDEYVQAIRKLSKRSGVSESEKLLVLFVVTGLPSDIRTKIQTMIRMEDLDKVSLDDIVEKARILWQETRKNDGSVAFATRSYRQDVTCFRYGKRGHFARDCHVQRVSPARCYSCGESGHNARSCSAQSKPPLTDFKKNITGAVKLLSNPGTPAETILSVNGRRARCLTDTGNSVTIVREALCGVEKRLSHKLYGIGGATLITRGTCEVIIEVEEMLKIKVSCMIVSFIFDNIDVILGMDSIEKLGELCIDHKGNIYFPKAK